MTAKWTPSFTSTEMVDVDVTIEPEELEAAGWRYVGTADQPTTEHVIDVIRDWHDDNHPQPWRFCSQEPCDTLRGREAGA